MRKSTINVMRLMCVLASCGIAITASTVSCSVASANALFPDGKETRLLLLLKDMKWQDNLDAHDVALVEKGLKSSNDMVGEEAIKVVALQRLTAFEPLLGNAAKTSNTAQITRKLVAEAFHSGKDPIDYLRTEWVKHREDNEWKEPYGIDNSIGDIVGLLVVTDVVKSMRRGEAAKFSLDGLKLNSLEQNLLHYGTMTPEDAVDDIFKVLGHIKIASTKEYEFAAVLKSYGKPAVLRLMEKFAQQQDLNAMSGYGIELLLTPLADYVTVHKLAADDAATLNTLIDHLEKHSSPYVRGEIPALRMAVEYVTKADDTDSAEDADK